MATRSMQKYPDVCRICLSSDADENCQEELYPIEYIFVQRCKLTEFITSFRDMLTVFVKDEMNTYGQLLPSMVCLKCVRQAQEAYKFVEQCRRTDQLLECYFYTLQTDEMKCTKNLEKMEDMDENQHLAKEEKISSGNSTSNQSMLVLDTQLASNDLEDLGKNKLNPNVKKKRFYCDKCDKSFSQSQTMRRHYRSSHDQSGQNIKSCTFCNKTFLRSDDLTRHVRIHTGERPYKCTVCAKTYKQWSELNEHRLTHRAQKKFQCTECSKKLSSRNGLYVHMKIHRGDKRFVCTHCSKRFTTSSALTAHVRRVHPAKTANPTAS